VGAPPPVRVEPHVQRVTGTAPGTVTFRTYGERDDVGQDASTLTLADATRAALEHDPRLQAAAARVRAALADAKQARLLPNPVLSVSVRYPEGGGKPMIDAGLSEDLLSLLTRPRRAGAADNRLRAAGAEALQTAIDVVAEVQARYVAVQTLDRRLAVLRERQGLVDRLLELARSRLQAGEAGRLDVITLDSERVGLEADVIQRAGELRDQRLSLARLVGRPSAAADWSVPTWAPVEPPVADERAWVATALRHRPEVESQRWELAALGDEAAVAGWGIWEGAGVGVESERDGDWRVGPGASTPIPLFDWGQARRERVAAQQVEARHKLTQARRQVIEEVRRAYAALEFARTAVEKVRGQLLPLQEQRREQAEASYKAGAADITAVLLAEQQSQEVRERLVELEGQQATALVQLQRAVGGAGIAPGVEPSTPRGATRPTSGPTTQSY
jgi:cobalt-zinc-cadmium efflux system outer membrane protein